MEKGAEDEGNVGLKELMAASACDCASCYRSLFSMAVLCGAGAVLPKFSIFLEL